MYLNLVSLFLLFGHSHNQIAGALEGKNMRLLPFEVDFIHFHLKKLKSFQRIFYNEMFDMFKVAPHLILTRNSSGHIVKMKGFSVEIVDWLSKYLKFTYVFRKFTYKLCP